MDLQKVKGNNKISNRETRKKRKNRQKIKNKFRKNDSNKNLFFYFIAIFLLIFNAFRFYLSLF